MIPVCVLCGEPITEMYDESNGNQNGDYWQYIETNGALYALTDNNELPEKLITDNLSDDATAITYGGSISVGVYGAKDWEGLQAGTKTIGECTDASESLPTHTAVAYRVYAYTSKVGADGETLYAYSAVLIERDPFILMGDDKKTYSYGYGDDGRYALPDISLFVDVKPTNASGEAYFSNPAGVTTNTGADGNPIEFDWSEMAVERVEMEWVNLTTLSGRLDEGYVLATVYYLTDEWAESFDEAYSGQIENETKDVLTGWCDMYIVEAEVDGTTHYYLYGWAYNVAYDGGAELHPYRLDAFEPNKA